MNHAPDLRRTVLHAWHAANGGRMVAFGGWAMPLHYAGGIVREHLATRRHAGLFDVSHMGRFEVEGSGATAWLVRVLTNDAGRLAPGQAHYTLVADEHGHAIDDAYLYRRAPERYLLVVNASNRAKVLAWLRARMPADRVTLVDRSDAIGMMALQGPAAEAILRQIVPAADLPPPRRNAIATARFEGEELVMARTGYTGEPVCFELFCPTARAVALWERLVSLGAVPCGLGARDSLRLEAGLPLYGHELGTDPEGRPLPIFAVALARFGVREPGGAEHVGRAALEAQRAEVEALRAGRPAPPGSRQVARRVTPIAAIGTRRPLRAGYRLLHEGRHAGWVTSGTVVPDAAAPESAAPVLRSIGLALIDVELLAGATAPLSLEADDGRGQRIPVTTVARHR